MIGFARKNPDVNPNIKRVTVMRQLGGVGDFLMLTPVFLGLKERYGRRCKVILATSWQYYSGALPLLSRNNPNIDEVVRVEPHEFVPFLLRRYRWDFCNVPNDHPPNCVIDTDLIIDLNTICSITESRQMPNVTQHRTDIWCDAANVKPSSTRPILNLDESEREFGRKWADEQLGAGVRIGVVLKAHDINRTWMHAEDLAFQLHHAGYRVGTIDIIKRLHPDIPAITGMDIRRLAGVIENLDAVVTADTGILHLAGTVGTPVLGIFGPTDARMRMREYAGHAIDSRRVVPCAPCWYAHGCLKDEDRTKHLACLQRISPDLVQAELETMLCRFGVTPP